MAFSSVLSLLSLLLAAWSPLASAQEADDVKSIPLRTHSLSQVRWHTANTESEITY